MTAFFVVTAGCLIAAIVVLIVDTRPQWETLWIWFLIALLLAGIIGVVVTGDARWLFVMVFPIIIFGMASERI